MRVPKASDDLEELAAARADQIRRKRPPASGGPVQPPSAQPKTAQALPVRVPREPQPSSSTTTTLSSSLSMKAKPAAPAEDDVGLLAQTRADHERERKAAEDEMKAGKAKALQAANARASLGGLGLSGATGVLNSDIGRTQDRSAVLAMSELGRKQRDEDFQAIQRQAAIDDLEDAQDEDVDGDGFINGKKVGGKFGDGNPDNDPADTGSRKDKEDDRNAEIMSMTQADFERLTQEELQALGWEPEPPPASRDANGREYVLWTAPNGETRKAYLDDAGELFSAGLEWQ